ncbi:hypothetical protein FA13DRAFT_1798548 [Coprinellus micaceus]|uniref:Uncharacterized protein n=1 Tax=Coprinellus micaceus TaxID=71717 RepID=A0A4Y7SLU3_COPMI|nr:hypothetical protein FA13DRAFT_1798548 [Coprinellus micaceus]
MPRPPPPTTTPTQDPLPARLAQAATPSPNPTTPTDSETKGAQSGHTATLEHQLKKVLNLLSGCRDLLTKYEEVNPWTRKDIAPLTEHAMAPWLDGTFEAFSHTNNFVALAPTTDPKALLEPVLQKLGSRTAAAVILETYGSTPGPFRNAYASHAWDCWQKAPSWPTQDAEWTEFFGEVRKSFREDIVLKHVAKVCLDLAKKLIVSLNMSTLRHQIDGTLQAGMMDFLKGASSFSHPLLLLRFVVAFCDLHRLIVQNTWRQMYEIPQDWNCDPHRDDVTLEMTEVAIKRIGQLMEDHPEAAKLRVGATTNKVKMWPLDAALDKWGWFMLFRCRMSDIGLTAHINTLEAAQPGTLKFIQSYASLDRSFKYIPLRLDIVPTILGGGMLYKSGIDGTRDITPEAVLADEASASVIAIRTLFAEQALDSFTTTPELEAQREELLKYVNKVLESRVGEASQSPNGLDKQLRWALEAGSQRHEQRNAEYVFPDSADQHPIISKGLWYMVDAFTAKPGLWARVVAEAMGSAFS